MKRTYPFLISIPHGGTEVPAELDGRLALTPDDLAWFCDPGTRTLFDFGDSVAAAIDTQISRMAVDLNRPPLPLPPKDPDGIIKTRTIDCRPVYREGRVPDIALIHRLLLAHYFPYHQHIDELLDRFPVRVAFDCHSMLPIGSPAQKDAGRSRPLICIGNYGDFRGRQAGGGLTTCPAEWALALAGIFRNEFSLSEEVAINNPFSGGFISNAHYWRKGIPWIQIEISRSLYENKDASGTIRSDDTDLRSLRRKLWNVLAAFGDLLEQESGPGGL